MKKRLLLKNFNKKGDYLLIIAVIILAVVGTVFIYSASNYSANKTYGDGFYFVKKQALGIAIGLITMFIAMNFDYQKLKKFTIPVSIVAFVTLGLVFVPKVGVEMYGAKRWIGFGGITIQPSEIAKFSLILFSATFVSNHPEKQKKFIGILPVLAFLLSIVKDFFVFPSAKAKIKAFMKLLTFINALLF